MEASQESAVPISATIISYRLTPDKVELLLIALYVLDEVAAGTPLPIKQLITKARRSYDADKLPDDLSASIGQLSDELCNPLFDFRHPLTPADRLLAIDPEGLTDDEAFAIIRDIEAKHGKIIFAEAS